MKNEERERYEAPQSKEIKVALPRCIALSGGIDPSSENPEVPWVI